MFMCVKIKVDFLSRTNCHSKHVHEHFHIDLIVTVEKLLTEYGRKLFR